MILLAVLILVALLLVGCLLRSAAQSRDVARLAAGLPERGTVAATDLSPAAARSVGGALTLRDNELGLVGRPDVLLRGAHGVVPVEEKRAGPGWAPGRLYRSHNLQLGGYFLLCQADPRVAKRPTHGTLRYVDDAGNGLIGGKFTIENTEELRQQVMDVLRRMRWDLHQPIVHRSHNVSARCRGCSVRRACDEAL